MKSASDMSQFEENRQSSYEPPMLTAIGNLHDVVAATTKALLCDSASHSTTGDGDVMAVSC